MRSDKQYENFVLELEWRHLKAAGNSGVFIWAAPTPAAPGNPYAKAVEVQILDEGYTALVAAQGGKTDWFTGHGDVFAISLLGLCVLIIVRRWKGTRACLA